MTVEDPFKHAVLGSGIFYKYPRAALTWLEAAFGFEPSMVVSDAEGRLVHSEMRFGDGYIVVDSEWADDVASPASVGGRNTQSVYIRLKDGLDAHCEQARLAGAEIIRNRPTSSMANGNTAPATPKAMSGPSRRPCARCRARKPSG
ncbi:hypothetical protein [Mesorhizobium sp.]|uniref:hypothetical protein n=1 Tax=Mesorhizobium sp. TaxID=1871066 RepID=UPI0025BAC58A|nr:hypothetical protein [Mesorhizobium sp.]